MENMVKVVKVHKKLTHRSSDHTLTVLTVRHKTKPDLFQRDTKEFPN